jgi:nicotinamide riboside transporter PnuC
MSPATTTLIEWISTLLSIAGFWLCIRHRSSCFVVFTIADLGWLASAFVNGHFSLLAQQIVYVMLNVIGYVMWRRDERIEQRLTEIEDRVLKGESVRELVRRPDPQSLAQ